MNAPKLSALEHIEQAIILIHSEMLTHQDDTNCAQGMQCPKMVGMQNSIAACKTAKARYEYGHMRQHSVHSRP
jgi:hypothetical protein